MGKSNALEIDELAFLQFDIYNGPAVTHYYYLSVLVSLFDGNTWFSDSSFTGINTLSESNDSVGLADFECFLQTLDGSLFGIYFVDMRVFETLQHLVVNVVSLTI